MLPACELTQPPTLPQKSGWICNPLRLTLGEKPSSVYNKYTCTGFNGIYEGKVKERTLSNGAPIPYGDALYQLTDEDKNKYFEPDGLGNFEKLNTGDNFHIEGSFKEGTLKRGQLHLKGQSSNLKYEGSFKETSNWVDYPSFNRGSLTVTDSIGNQSIKSGVFDSFKSQNNTELYLKSGTQTQKIVAADYIGIGINFTKEDNLVVIKELFPEGSAALEGWIKSGDIILGAFDDSLKDSNYIGFDNLATNEVAEIIRGAEGTYIKLEILPYSSNNLETPNEPNAKIVSLERKLIKNNNKGCEISWNGEWNSSNQISGSPVVIRHPSATVKAHFRRGQPSRGGMEIKTNKRLVIDRESARVGEEKSYVATTYLQNNKKIFKESEDYPASFSYGGVWSIDQGDNAIMNARIRWDSLDCNSYPEMVDKTVILKASDKRYIVNQSSLSFEDRRALDFEIYDKSPEDWDDDHKKDSQIILIETINKESNREVTFVEEVNSSYRSGYRTVYNPDYDQAMINVQIAMDNLSSARIAKASRNTECGKADSFGKALLCSILDNSGVSSAESKLERARSILNSTPRNINEPVFDPYSFNKVYVSATKESTVRISLIDSEDKKFREKTVTTKDNQRFVVIDRELPPTDKNRSSHRRGTSIEANIDEWLDEQAIPANYDNLSELIPIIVSEGKLQDFNTGMRKITDKEEKKQPRVSQSNKMKKDSATYDYEESVLVIEDLQGGLGTGFYVRDELIMTNAHVVGDKKYMTIRNKEGESFIGQVLKKDLGSDLAVLTTKLSGKPLELKPGCKIKRGEDVTTIGHPKGFEYSLTKGIVSSVRSMHLIPGASRVRYIQIDAPLNPGNSGGPLMDSNGYVIGVNTWGYEGNSLNFSIHCSEIKRFIEKYIP